MIGQRLQVKSAALLRSIEAGLPRLMQLWLVAAIGACSLRVATSPLHGRLPTPASLLPYALLVAAPLISMALALRWFAPGDRQPQPVTRLARWGQWRSVTREAARRLPAYGATGMMVALLIGMLANVPVRALEYLAAMPALAGRVPRWLEVLNLMMTLDVLLLTSLYTIAFVAALRRVPLFPRLLVTIWAVDLVMQLLIASAVAGTPGLPMPVAAALHDLLYGNIVKVSVSIALWLPYLLLSERVNLTYRLRVPA